MFDLELLTPSMNYIPVRKENYADSKEQGISCDDAEDLDVQQFIVHGPNIHAAQNKPSEERTADKEVPLSSEEQVLHDGLADYNNMDPTIDVPSTPTLRIHKIHPQSQIIGKSTAGVQTRRKLQDSTSNQHQALLSFIYKQNRTNHKDQQTCLFACFLSQEEPKKVSQALADESWVEAMQEELLQFKLQEVYVDDIIFGSTKSSMVKDFEDLMQKEFKMSSMGELTFFLGLQVKQTSTGIFLSQDKYVKDILNKFDFRTIKPASTPIEAHKSLGKDEEGEDVDVHLYRFQVTPKVSHLHAVKRIFRYLKHQPKLGLWYPKDSPFHLEAFSDSDYAGDNHDRRSTSGGCQYLGRRLVSWQCKKQTIVAISSTEAEYVAAASCCAQIYSPKALRLTRFNFGGNNWDDEPITTLEGRITYKVLLIALLSKLLGLAQRYWSTRESAAGGRTSNSPHSRAASSARDAQGTPTQSATHSQRTASVQGTASFYGTASIPKSPNDYTPTDASQTSGGDEGLLDIYALNREVKRLKRQTLSQAKQIKLKLKKLSKFVQPVVQHNCFLGRGIKTLESKRDEKDA
ncbi:uncharacterized mitochondrial protein-like protein [Tanacetum coccineum]|uniref:Uncharacterized mitochondrial protein-like protein n=1 Tax=Tanacetum coccineum TaxID=301880 RepID=A0ABQ5GLE3_9ASTR